LDAKFPRKGEIKEEFAGGRERGRLQPQKEGY
jgi:hypothetical protein